MNKLLSNIIVAGVMSFTYAAISAVLYENPFQGTNTGWFSGNSSGYKVYDNFTLSDNSIITEFAFSAYDSGYVPTSFEISIYSDNTFTNTLFQQTYLIGEAIITPDGSAQIISVSIPSLSLSAGEYWVSPYGLSGSLLALNVTGAQGDNALFQAGNGNVGGELAMRISGDVSAVPLPAALPLMLSGLGALGFAVRRKKV